MQNGERESPLSNLQKEEDTSDRKFQFWKLSTSLGKIQQKSHHYILCVLILSGKMGILTHKSPPCYKDVHLVHSSCMACNTNEGTTRKFVCATKFHVGGRNLDHREYALSYRLRENAEISFEEQVQGPFRFNCVGSIFNEKSSSHLTCCPRPCVLSLIPT